MSIIDKIRKGRESSVEINGHTFKYRRPTDLEAMGMTYESIKEGIYDVSKFYLDWDMTELDFDAGGTSEKVRFSEELFWEWLQDNPEYWEKMIDAVLDSYKQYRKKRADSGN